MTAPWYCLTGSQDSLSKITIVVETDLQCISLQSVTLGAFNLLHDAAVQLTDNSKTLIASTVVDCIAMSPVQSSQYTPPPSPTVSKPASQTASQPASDSPPPRKMQRTESATKSDDRFFNMTVVPARQQDTVPNYKIKVKNANCDLWAGSMQPGGRMTLIIFNFGFFPSPRTGMVITVFDTSIMRVLVDFSGLPGVVAATSLPTIQTLDWSPYADGPFSIGAPVTITTDPKTKKQSVTDGKTTYEIKSTTTYPVGAGKRMVSVTYDDGVLICSSNTLVTTFTKA
jgi:hypothetical protein